MPSFQSAGSIVLHTLNAGASLGSWKERIEAAFGPAIRDISRYLTVGEVDVVAYASTSVIPELGLGAYTEQAHLVRIWLDPGHPNLAECFNASFAGLLAHELHHLVRMRGPGYGETLREALVSEGLACQFEREVTGRLPIYGTELTPEVSEAWLTRIAPFLDGPFSANWMFGSAEEGIERSFGYRLGSSLVRDWLQKCGTTASQAAHTPCSSIARAWAKASCDLG